MAGTRLAFPAIAETLHANRRREARRIHVLWPRHPQQVAAGGRQHFRVLFLLPGIAREVLVRSELQRIDEDGRGDTVGGVPRLFDQPHMARVKGSHRRHEREAFSARAQGDKRGIELPGLTD